MSRPATPCSATPADGPDAARAAEGLGIRPRPPTRCNLGEHAGGQRRVGDAHALRAERHMESASSARRSTCRSHSSAAEPGVAWLGEMLHGDAYLRRRADCRLWLGYPCRLDLGTIWRSDGLVAGQMTPGITSAYSVTSHGYLPVYPARSDIYYTHAGCVKKRGQESCLCRLLAELRCHVLSVWPDNQG